MKCLLAIAAVVGCSSEAPPPPAPAAPADASIDVLTVDPTYPSDIEPVTTQPKPSKKAGRPIEIMLRSSPPGSQAYVDGVLVGTTPTFWAGETGAEHEFTFVAPKHAFARYRFWPIQTGVLHARLEAISGDVDAGVPPAHLVAPPPGLVTPPGVATPVAPTPPIVDPAAPE